MVLTSKWVRIQPEFQIWADQVVAASWTQVGSPKHAEKMLIQLRSPTGPSWPAVELWNGGMMPFITIISFAKWDPLLSSHTYLGPIPEPRQRQQSCDWNMMQVSPHGCGGATSSDQSVVRGCVVTWKQHTLLAQKNEISCVFVFKMHFKPF